MPDEEAVKRITALCRRTAGGRVDARWQLGGEGGAVLGHATISITLDTYSHAIPAVQEEAAALIAGPVFTRR